MEVASIATRPDVEALRARLHRMWDTVAGGWGEHAAFVEQRGAEVTRALLELAQPRPGERVLELACGAGGVGIAAADLVGPTGEVVLSDVAPAMAAIAGERVRALGLTNVSTRRLDLEAIDEPDRSFDVVFCREGLMLVPDPVQAAREIARVLRPGGRVAVAVWGPRERNPWLTIMFDAVSAQLAAPMPPPGVPGPFSLDDPDRLASVLAAAELTALDVRELDVPYRAASADEWWHRTAALAGPLAGRLASLPEPAQRALRDRATTAVAAYETGAGLELPGVALLAGALRS